MQERTIAILLFCFVMPLFQLNAQGSDDQPLTPKSHITIENPKRLTVAEARDIYASVIEELVSMYVMSEDPVAAGFLKWKRFNTAPYLSGTHGNRYVNNYANDKAGDYAASQRGTKAPVGAVYAKDSFTITSAGKVFGGALFLMEKLPPGSSVATADWRYWMILPDGSLHGDSRGDSPENVAFCHACHKLVAKKDHLYFVPKTYR